MSASLQAQRVLRTAHAADKVSVLGCTGFVNTLLQRESRASIRPLSSVAASGAHTANRTSTSVSLLSGTSGCGSAARVERDLERLSEAQNPQPKADYRLNAATSGAVELWAAAAAIGFGRVFVV